jgi:hypothetical protein
MYRCYDTLQHTCGLRQGSRRRPRWFRGAACPFSRRDVQVFVARREIVRGAVCPSWRRGVAVFPARRALFVARRATSRGAVCPSSRRDGPSSRRDGPLSAAWRALFMARRATYCGVASWLLGGSSLSGVGRAAGEGRGWRPRVGRRPRLGPAASEEGRSARPPTGARASGTRVAIERSVEADVARSGPRCKHHTARGASAAMWHSPPYVAVNAPRAESPSAAV